MFLLLAASVLAAPVCPASVAEVTAAVADAEQAFVRLDRTGLDRSLADAAAELACMTSPIPPTLAARLHRAKALAAFVAGDEPGARRALYAARVVDPVGDYPSGLLPADHPLRGLLVNAVLGTPASAPIPAPAQGSVWFDGRISLSRPSDRPTVFQRTGPKGEVVDGAWLSPDEALPTFDLAKSEAATKAVGPSVFLASGAGAALVASGVTYGLAAVANARFRDPATPDEDIPGIYQTNNTLVYTSVGLGALAVAGGVGAVVVGRW